MIEKRSVSGTIFDVCNGLLMTAIFVIMVYPDSLRGLGEYSASKGL